MQGSQCKLGTEQNMASKVWNKARTQGQHFLFLQTDSAEGTEGMSVPVTSSSWDPDIPGRAVRETWPRH